MVRMSEFCDGCPLPDLITEAKQAANNAKRNRPLAQFLVNNVATIYESGAALGRNFKDPEGPLRYNTEKGMAVGCACLDLALPDITNTIAPIYEPTAYQQFSPRVADAFIDLIWAQRLEKPPTA
jgi:hypothetical protein